MTRLVRVPTLVVTGRRGVGKTTLIARLLTERPAGETWAVLLTERGEAGLEASDGVAVAESGGCPCCTAQLAFRVSLTRLLREAKPARLFVELAAASHVAGVLKTLSDPWVAPVVALHAVVHVTDTTCADEWEQACIAAAQTLCVRGGADPLARLCAGKRVLDAATATLARLDEWR